ncbi:hypothetical protein IEO21_06838 [Rhodonia placenta]|uniref:Major facilitator superfamily (MFS) profile domain-containing protein n=1 Tax=Rhodonia placenta TaxID=104341 RepID=A0A8H7NZ44_9APHY|nr:hypothetical protein IEO21_06838 [Postia placenta]
MSELVQAEKRSLSLTLPFETSPTQSDVDPQKVLRKLDWHLLPFLSLLYLLAYLDRTNVGNAKIAGLTTDIGLTGLQFNLCSAMFFVTYCAFEVPSNVALKLLRPSRWIPSIMFCWGIIMVSMAFVKDFVGLLIVRLFLGAAESGLLPGLAFYICLWYPRVAQAQRLAIFVSACTASGAFGGLLAYGIEKMSGTGGLAGWSWIFLLEGLITIVVAVGGWWYMDDYPESASFLSVRERDWLVQALKEDTASSSKAIRYEYLMQALKNPYSYLLASIEFFIMIPLFAFALFLPTIIVGLGYSSLHAQLLTVPPNICGCLATILFGIGSDRLGVRGPFVLAGSLLSLVGYTILLATTTPTIGYIGTIIAACGLVPSSACLLAWTGGNAGGDMKRGAMLAMLTGLGDLGAIASSFIYRPQDSPRYRPGHATNIACSSMIAILSIIAMFAFARANKQKHTRCIQEGLSADNAEDYRELGDNSPLYRCDTVCLKG